MIRIGDVVVVEDNKCDAMNSLLKDNIREMLHHKFGLIMANTKKLMVEEKFGLEGFQANYLVDKESIHEYVDASDKQKNI